MVDSPQIVLNFDPDLLLSQIKTTFVSLLNTLVPHCEVCRSRNGMLRLHDATIHFDPEEMDFLDNKTLWGQRFPEEEFAAREDTRALTLEKR